MMFELALPDEMATHRLGHQLGTLAFPGLVLALEGPLGAGKTTLVQGMAAGLGVEDLAEVTSPTFVLHQIHPGRLTLHHFDVCRLASVQQFIELGALEFLESGGVSAIEWADRVGDALPRDRLWISLNQDGLGRRAILRAAGDRHAELLATLRHQCSVPTSPLNGPTTSRVIQPP